jgi:hypothetical protein
VNPWCPPDGIHSYDKSFNHWKVTTALDQMSEVGGQRSEGAPAVPPSVI